MPHFEPFSAWRYAATDLDPLVAPPYDVLSDADLDALQARSPHNITWVDVPRGGPDRYAQAADRLTEWQRDGVLVRDPEPSFTIYRMRFTDDQGEARDVAGVLGGLEVVDAGAGGVLPHERTTPKASTDRLDLTRATATNLSPVWGLSLAGGLTALLAEPGEQVGRVRVEGVEHVVERVSEPDRVAAIREAVGSADVLVADGHHRYGIARTYRDEVRTETGRTDTAAELTLTFVNELVADQLSVAAIHRLYSGVDPDEMRAVLARSFDLRPTDRPTAATLSAMAADGHLVLLRRDGVGQVSAETMTPRLGAFDEVRALDGAWLEAALAGENVAVDYQHGLTETVNAVTSGGAAAAVLIRPVGVAEIERTAREGVLMPPKSTFFTPKLRTGLVLRSLPT